MFIDIDIHNILGEVYFEGSWKKNLSCFGNHLSLME